MKSDKLFNATNSLIIGISLLIFGIIMCIGKDKLYINFVNIFLIVILFLSIKQFLNYFIGKKNKKKISFNQCFFNLIFCLIFSLFKNIPLSILPIIFGLYLLYLVVSIPIIFSPLKNLNKVLTIIGIYTILLGVNYIIDFITFIIPKRVKNKIRRNIRISLPVFIEAIIPYTVLNEINYLLDKDNYDKPFVFEEKSEAITADLEVFVHISNRGFNRMGHVDLCYKGKVISYGNYDDKSVKLKTMIGDGVIFTTTKEKYIPFCIKHSKKTIFVFGLKLTERQRKNIEKTIDKLFDNVYCWEPPYLQEKGRKKLANANKHNDYASKLYQATNAKFYKVKSGRFKHYFVLGSNCCKLADYIIGKSGIDLLKMNGIITPGTYYEYLNREFQKKNSMVVSRKIYNSKNVNKNLKTVFKGFSK